MDFIDEQDDIRVLRQLVQNRLDTFFKLAAIFGPCHDRCHIQADHTFVEQNTGDFALDDTQGQAFHDRRFADTRFTDQDRIVFLAATQYLRQAFDLLLSSDDRIETVFRCSTRHIRTEVIQYRRVVR